MSNIDKLLSRAEGIGTSEIPAGSGNSPEIQDALMKVFEKHPKSWFRSRDLGKALEESGYKCKKVSDILFAMKKTGKVQQARKGVYGLNGGVPLPGAESTVAEE